MRVFILFLLSAITANAAMVELPLTTDTNTRAMYLLNRRVESTEAHNGYLTGKVDTLEKVVNRLEIEFLCLLLTIIIVLISICTLAARDHLRRLNLPGKNQVLSRSSGPPPTSPLNKD